MQQSCIAALPASFDAARTLRYSNSLGYGRYHIQYHPFTKGDERKDEFRARKKRIRFRKLHATTPRD
jgi:hypothetical protein